MLFLHTLNFSAEGGNKGSGSQSGQLQLLTHLPATSIRRREVSIVLPSQVKQSATPQTLLPSYTQESIDTSPSAHSAEEDSRTLYRGVASTGSYVHRQLTPGRGRTTGLLLPPGSDITWLRG